MESYKKARELSEGLSEFVKILKQKRKEVVESLDNEAMGDYVKGELAKELAKIDATILIQEYDCVQYTMLKGVRYYRDLHNFGQIKNMEASGKTACEIQLWSGMDEFSTDKRKLDEWL